ncbi:cytochrome c [Pragia fontium]|uniref:cytochrome c n=1 Tax=Pragia fontium TaxID=82985 RepID=UPI0006499354|nr:cytochrome c [Pragia fontium]AKJ42315.1 alcohol dehydrogenase [Pragia fontium]
MKRTFLTILLCGGLQFQVQAQDVTKGEYLARVGDCVACHTAAGGKDFAGGRPMETPIGMIYSTNITPDPEFGIGNYSFDDFDLAMREGKTKDGRHLYPAMPYTAYAKLSEEDMRALYDYFMQGVTPEKVANRESDIPWPLSMRWPLGLWNSMFHENQRFVADSQRDADWNRGAYLVQGLGHCGACHTPRGLAFQEKAMTQTAPEFLSGAEIDGWYAPDIRGNKLSQSELVDLLKTGSSQHQSLAGPMAEVVTYSTQYLSDADLQSIAVYLNALPGDKAPEAKPAATLANYDEAKGLYQTYCSTCHGLDGKGVANVIPSLANNPAIVRDNALNLIHVVYSGADTPRTEGHISYKMPGYKGVISNQEMTDVLNYIRNSWGNSAPLVTLSEVNQATKDK